MPDPFEDTPEASEKAGEDIRWWLDRMLSWGTDRSDQGERLWGETRGFIDKLRTETYSSFQEISGKGFDEEDYDSVGGRYVGELAASAEAAAQRHIDNLKENPRRTAEEIACCILQGLFTQLGGNERRFIGENVRSVARGEFRQHLRDVELVLGVMEEMSTPGVTARWDLQILNKDFSARARMVAERALFAPATLFLSQSERYMVLMASRVRRQLARTRCQPILRMWGAVSSWLFGQTDGLFWKLKSFCTQCSARIHREMKGALSLPSSAGSASEGGASYSLSMVRAIRESIGLILEGASALDRCRLRYPRGGPRAREERSSRGERSPEEPRRPGPRRPDPRRSPRGEDPRGEGVGEENSRAGNPPGGRGQNAQDPLPPGFRVETDPVLGPLAESPLEEGRVYLTQANAARVLMEAGTPPERAIEAAQGRNCEDSLSADTIDALASAGIDIQ